MVLRREVKTIDETEDYDKSATPTAHKTTHQDGGSDEISVLGLSGLLGDAQTPLAHKTSHQDGGADEISVEGLAGELTAEQKSAWAKVSGKPTTFDPSAHKTSHQDGGADEISVAGLAGLLADLQNPTDHTHQSSGSGVGGKLDHGLALNGLTDDDHTQYALLAGRAGGQTLIGGSGVTDILKLQGTSGNGTAASPAIQMLVGNNGAIAALTILNNGNTDIQGIFSVGGTATFNVNNSTGLIWSYTGISCGTNPPTSGQVRLSYGGAIIIRNQAGTLDVNISAMGSIADDKFVEYGSTAAFAAAILGFKFYPGTNSPKVTFLQSGKVGIGDTDPGELLDVAGNINATGVFKIDDVQVIKEQQVHIADPAETTAANTTAIKAILAMCEAHGLIASA